MPLYNPPTASALTTATAALSVDAAIPSANTYVDGPSLGSLAAGTYLVTLTESFEFGAAGTPAFYGRITDGTTHYASAQGGLNGSGGVGHVSMSAIIMLASATTIKGQLACSSATNGVIKAAQSANGSGNNASHIRAVKVG